MNDRTTRYITVKVHPDAGMVRILRTSADRYEVWLSEPARDNRANKQLLSLMRRVLGVENVRMHAGHHGRSKKLRVEKIDGK